MIKSLSPKVEECLKEYPQTRNSDIALYIAVIYKNYNSHLKIIDGKSWINIEDIPKQSDITRIRQKIQYEKKLYPATEEKVLKQRLKLERKYRKDLGYPY